MEDMIKAVIFDLNGVFIQSPKLTDRLREEFGVPDENCLPILKEVMARIRKPGAGDTFGYWRPHLEEWGIDMTKEEFFDFWFGAEKEVPELIDVANRVKNKGAKLFVLSNNFVERSEYYKKNFSFLNIFDKVYYSWQTGFVKPDPRSFENLLSENDLRPEECIYFDDSEENVRVAKDLGMNAFLFDGVEGLNRVLIEHNLI